MARINDALTGPLGAAINAVLMLFACFMLTQMYVDFKELQKSVNAVMSKIELQEYRISVLEHTKGH